MSIDGAYGATNRDGFNSAAEQIVIRIWQGYSRIKDNGLTGGIHFILTGNTLGGYGWDFAT